jgi:hypothetical protein
MDRGAGRNIDRRRWLAGQGEPHTHAHAHTHTHTHREREREALHAKNVIARHQLLTSRRCPCSQQDPPVAVSPRTSSPAASRTLQLPACSSSRRSPIDCSDLPKGRAATVPIASIAIAIVSNAIIGTVRSLSFVRNQAPGYNHFNFLCGLYWELVLFCGGIPAIEESLFSPSVVCTLEYTGARALPPSIDRCVCSTEIALGIE